MAGEGLVQGNRLKNVRGKWPWLRNCAGHGFWPSRSLLGTSALLVVVAVYADSFRVHRFTISKERVQ